MFIETPTVEDVLASLRRLRVHIVTVEYDLQDAIAKQLAEDRISFEKECRLAARNRIDFLIPGGIGVEVKKGKPNSGQVAAQIERYCQFEVVQTLILVVERNVATHLNRSENDKPVHYIALNKLWGIAL
jgi:hypothetical protein